MKFLIIHFSQASLYFFPLRSKYSPQHPVLKYPQSMFVLNVRDQVSQPENTTGIIIFFSILISLHFYFAEGKKSDFVYCIYKHIEKIT
jgi:hypothetical protein